MIKVRFKTPVPPSISTAQSLRIGESCTFAGYSLTSLFTRVKSEDQYTTKSGIPFICQCNSEIVRINKDRDVKNLYSDVELIVYTVEEEEE